MMNQQESDSIVRQLRPQYHGIVCLLPDEVTDSIVQTWHHLETHFSISALPFAVPVPHISLHVAREYSVNALAEKLEELAAGIAPFEATIEGIGFFTTEEYVMYHPVVRTEPLVELHRAVWRVAESLSSGQRSIYSLPRWMPHVTLAQGDITPTRAGNLLADQMRHHPHFDFTIDRIGLLHNKTTDEPDAPLTLHRSFALTG